MRGIRDQNEQAPGGPPRSTGGQHAGADGIVDGVPEEQALPGGKLSEGVVRAGTTVHRPTGPWTPAVHALLRHLEAAGFDGAPRVFGYDERGREVVEFIEGAVPWPEAHHDLLGPEEAVRRVGQL